MNPLKLQIRLEKRIVSLVLLGFEKSEIFLHFVIVNNILEAIKDT